MAVCRACRKEMTTANGCNYRYVVMDDGKKYRRENVGDEGWVKPGNRCGDCGALYGNLHHPGCDIENCPACHGQLLSCDCPIQSYQM